MLRAPSLLFIVLLSLGLHLHAQEMSDLTLKVFRHADVSLRISVAQLGDSVRFPRATLPNGRWKEVPVTDWTSGFFPGTLWYQYEFTEDPFFRQAAERWTAKLEPMQMFTGNHDIGFMIGSSFGNGYRLTGEPSYREVLLQAARTAVTRYSPAVGCIKSWDNPRWEYPVIVDNLMNLELLFWAVQNGADSSLYRIAVSHAEKTRQNHVRPNGSTYHVVNYDPTSGRVLGRQTAQGYADSSTWARGQAWAVYGFTMVYRFTRDPRFLETAEKVAAYFVDHLPEDRVPYWDFRAPGIPNEPRDASAAAIAASGLLELSTLATDPARAAGWRSAATNILRSLASDSYLSTVTPSNGILLHSVTSKPANIEVDVSLIYADYYLLEALLRLRRMTSTD